MTSHVRLSSIEDGGSIQNGRDHSQTDQSPFLKRTSSNRKARCIAVSAVILDVLVLMAFVVLVYFLRCTEVFPVRMYPVSCKDVSISLSSAEIFTRKFAFSAQVSHVVVFILSLVVPPLVMCIGEILIWRLSPTTINDVTRSTFHKVPRVVRRLVRIVGIFCFGFLALVIFVDVTKLMIGRLRPTFLEVCHLNRTVCKMKGGFHGNDACLTNKRNNIRDERLSFPSLHSALSSYSAIFLTVYINCAPGMKLRATLLRPLLTSWFLLMSLLCGLSRYVTNHSHWTDVLAGFIVGVTFAMYHSMLAFRSPAPITTPTTERLNLQLQQVVSEQKHIHQWMRQRGVYTGLMGPTLHIPRARLKPAVVGITDLISNTLGQPPEPPFTNNIFPS